MPVKEPENAKEDLVLAHAPMGITPTHVPIAKAPEPSNANNNGVSMPEIIMAIVLNAKEPVMKETVWKALPTMAIPTPQNPATEFID